MGWFLETIVSKCPPKGGGNDFVLSFTLEVQIKSTMLLHVFLQHIIVLEKVCSQQFQGIILLMVFDFQGL